MARRCASVTGAPASSTRPVLAWGSWACTPHDLRHTAASLAIAAGANIKTVQRMLGHASAAMTLDVYAGLFGDDLDAVAALLDSHVPHLRHRGEIEVARMLFRALTCGTWGGVGRA